MAVLQMNNAQGGGPRTGISDLPRDASREQELDAMLDTLLSVMDDTPDVVIRTCMAIMGRCTEIHVGLVRHEIDDRKAKYFRTSQLQKVMELCDFMFKGASRLVEVARQEIDLSR